MDNIPMLIVSAVALGVGGLAYWQHRLIMSGWHPKNTALRVATMSAQDYALYEETLDKLLRSDDSDDEAS